MGNILFNKVPYHISRGEIDFSNHTFKAALLNSSYSPNASHDRWSDVSEFEISGTGYTSAGVALSGLTLTESSGVTKVDASDPQWLNAYFTARYMVIYDSETNYLLCLLDFGDNKTAVGSTFTYEFHADGFMKFSV